MKTLLLAACLMTALIIAFPPAAAPILPVYVLWATGAFSGPERDDEE